MTDFMNVEMIATWAGSITVIVALTQAAKYYLNFDFDPKWYTLIFSFIINAARLAFITKVYTPETIVFTLIDVLGMAFAAVGGYESIVKPVVNKMQANKENKANSEEDKTE